MLRRINKTARPVGHGLIALLAVAWFTGICQQCWAAPIDMQALPAQGEHCPPPAPSAHPDCERHCDCAALESLALPSAMDAIVLSAAFPVLVAVPAWRADINAVRPSVTHAYQAERACLHPLARFCIQLK
jgi:hypothetical protein